MFLEVQGIDVRYGRNHAVKEVDLALDEREIVTVLGANGAGKSSLLKAIQGTEKSGGKVIFDGVDISGWTAPRRVRAGLVLVPEGRQIFVSLTVHENLQMGGYCRTDDITKEIEAIYDRFPNLAERRDMSASVLSGGEQQMLAISQAHDAGRAFAWVKSHPGSDLV
jgi:branched-chain amino acid transport system ATP-binding protein